MALVIECTWCVYACILNVIGPVHKGQMLMLLVAVVVAEKHLEH